jgi:ketosteroid isomerase-like protein
VTENVEIARRGFEAAAHGDFEAVGEILDPDVKWHGGDPSAPGSCHNRAQAMNFMREAHGTGPIGELVEVVDAGDKVVVVMRRRTDDGEGSELVATLTTFRDGKAVEMVHYPNPEDAFTAAGLGKRSGDSSAGD